MVYLTNLVSIGQGAPNQLKDKRQATCVCAWSLDKKEFVRIYPVPLGWFRRWDVFDVEAEPNPQDNRENTWKIKNSKIDWKKLGKWIKKKDPFPKKERIALIRSIPMSVLSDLIDNKKSFGLIKPIIKDFKLKQRKKATTKQLTLFGMEDLDKGPFAIINQKDYKYSPHIVYECDGECKCKNKEHTQSITEWGCYEYMRKNPGKEINLKDNLRLFDDDYEKYLLVGNMHKAPQTYIIIDLLRFKKN